MLSQDQRPHSPLGWPRNSVTLQEMDFRKRAELALITYRTVDETTGCWLWTGCRTPIGHGQVRIKGANYVVTRLSAMLYLGLDITNRFRGSRKDCSQVNHKCANPSCFNPAHLYIGTQRQNLQDIPQGRRGRQIRRTARTDTRLRQ